MLEHSRVYGLFVGARRTLSAFVRGSFFYRWLTAEPDPDVIVIDLRDTWTVGPIIAVLDRIVDILERAVSQSGSVELFVAAADRTLDAPIRMAGFGFLLAATLLALSAIAFGSERGLFAAFALALGGLAVFETRSWAELRETRPVGVLIEAFEPPEPPEVDASDRSESSDPSDRSESSDSSAQLDPSDPPETAAEGDDS